MKIEIQISISLVEHPRKFSALPPQPHSPPARSLASYTRGERGEFTIQLAERQLSGHPLVEHLQ